MCANKTGIYLVTFSMIESINSQTGWGEKAMRRGIMVTSQFGKIGKFENGEEGRRKNYHMTFGSNFKMEILWSGNLDKNIIRQLESTLKKHFKEFRHRSPLTRYPTEYIDLTKIPLEFVRSKALELIQDYIADL